MKRFAAIVGPTPEFIRWTIEKNCPLRENDDAQSPGKCQTRLRPIREIARATADNRLFEGICVWDRDESAGPLRGFIADEVFEFYGGRKAVEDCCSACNANCAGAEAYSLAGCYGWLERPQDLAELKARGNELTSEQASHFPPAQQWWYRLWMNRSLRGQTAKTALELLSGVFENSKADDDWRRFAIALERSGNDEFSVWTELVPAGVSDGETWSVGSCCPKCAAPMPLDSRRCDVCPHRGGPHPQRNKKVLGARPYVPLELILGAQRTSEFQTRFNRRAQNRD